MSIAGYLALDAAAWLAVLPASAVPALLAWRARRRGRSVPPWSVVLECLAVALAVVALAGPRLETRAGGKAPVLLLRDVSASVRGQEPSGGDLTPKALGPPGTPVEVYRFAENVVPASASGTDAGASATRIGPVLRMIAHRAGGGLCAAVVLTDGQFTDDWQPAAAAAGASGADVLIVPLERPVPDARVTGVSARRGAGDRVDLTVSLSANAPLQRTLTVRRAAGGPVLAEADLSLLPDNPASVPVADSVPADASAQYVAALSAGDSIPENDSAATVLLPLRQKAAVVALPPGARAMTDGLDLPAARLRPADLPDRPEGLAEYAAIVLCDPDGSAFTLAQRRALGEYVGAGGGLVMIGTGPHGSPGERDDPLNRVLPLLTDPFQRRPLQLVVVLDRSGSMGEPAERPPDAPAQRKFDLAVEAVVALKEHLTPRDSLRVLAFSDRPEELYDSGGGPADFAALRAATGRLGRPEGSTRVTPALNEALSRPATGARTPMLLVVSDVLTEDFDPSAWADTIRRAGAQLAVVAIGQAPQTVPGAAPLPVPPLETLAKLLDAPYVRTRQMDRLAEVFAGMVRAGRGSAVRTGPVALVATAPLFDGGPDALPAADAYVLSALREGAVLLARTATGDPVLARMQSGLGRTVSLALPLSDRLNAPWQTDPAGQRLLSAALRWVLRSGGDSRFDAILCRRGDALRLDVTARQPDGAAMNALHLTVRVWTGAQAIETELAQVAPGRYEGQVECPEDAPAGVTVQADGAPVWHGSVEALYPREFAAIGPDMASLRRLADLTGGRVVRAEEVPDALRQASRRRMAALWPVLLGAAGGIMLAEWCLTRVTRR